MSTIPPEPLALHELISRYQVWWDVWPEYIFVNREKRQIGFDLELSGSHEHGSDYPEPGCGECRNIYSALHRIAEDLLQKEGENCTGQIEPFDQGVHYSRRHGNRPEVSLTIRILHKTALERPVDASEVRSLAAIQKRLEELGASQRR